ncbi:MAG: sugar ABC transporter permease [Verrucomicrobia bacterium]|mgnify:CR=1 FL=1|jgi:raffinose/stachyose/melibiose transport system permease protein|nr:sugar ABC transporter permease [Verrucomicrobiota bacterium]
MKRISYQLKSTATCYGIILPGVLLLLVFVYAPVVWAIVSSFSQFEIGGAQKFVGLANYKEYLVSDPTCWPSMGTMFLLTLFAVIIRLSVPLIVAKLIYSLPRERSRYIYRIIFLVPIVVPGVAVQLIWGGMIYSEHGMLNEILRAINLEQWTHGWLSDPRTVLGAIVMMGFPFIGGFDVLIYYAGLSSIPDSVTEAANLDGCTGISKFFLIDIPMVLSQLKLILMLTIIGGLQGFEALFVLTKGGPGFKTMVPGLWMYFNAFSFQRMGYACSIGVILFLMIFGLTLFNIKYFKSSEEIQGVS